MSAEEISIIVPVYNAESFLDSCVESILSQTYKNWRLLLINDGSSDASAEICEKWSSFDNRISTFHQNNGGAGAARNFGISVSSTKWITFVDADDTIEPTFLENFHSEGLGDNEIAIQGYKRIRPNGELLSEFKNFNNATYNGDGIVESFGKDWLLDYGQTVGKLYPLQLIKNQNISFPTEFLLSEDHCFFLSVLLHTTGIQLHSGTLYNYIDWSTGLNLTARQYKSPELWQRYLSLSSLYHDIVNRFDISEKKVLNWFQYFAFTGALSLYIQSLKDSDGGEKMIHIQNLKSQRANVMRYFNPHSVKGKVVKMAISYFPSCVLNILF